MWQWPQWASSMCPKNASLGLFCSHVPKQTLSVTLRNLCHNLINRDFMNFKLVKEWMKETRLKKSLFSAQRGQSFPRGFAIGFQLCHFNRKRHLFPLRLKFLRYVWLRWYQPWRWSHNTKEFWCQMSLGNSGSNRFPYIKVFWTFTLQIVIIELQHGRSVHYLCDIHFTTDALCVCVCIFDLSREVSGHPLASMVLN